MVAEPEVAEFTVSEPEVSELVELSNYRSMVAEPEVSELEVAEFTVSEPVELSKHRTIEVPKHRIEPTMETDAFTTYFFQCTVLWNNGIRKIV